MPYSLRQKARIYRRGQVEWALWRFSTLDLPGGDEPLSAFRARVKHLLQLDRSGALFASTEFCPPVAHALSWGQSLKTGIDAYFSAFDAFCLAIALDLLRAGFKQSEVLLLIGHLRPRLGKPFADILENPPAFRSRLRLANRPEPKDEGGDDRRVFLVIQRVECSEAFPAFTTTGKQNPGAIFREPLFCLGIQELGAELGKMDHLFRRAIVLEIAHMAARVAEFLDQAPYVKRGRPSSTFKRA